MHALAVLCPECGAAAGDHCVGYPDGLRGLPIPSERVHAARIKATEVRQAEPHEHTEGEEMATRRDEEQTRPTATAIDGPLCCPLCQAPMHESVLYLDRFRCFEDCIITWVTIEVDAQQ